MAELPPNWTRATLGDVIELSYGKALPVAQRQPGVAPVIGSGGHVGTHTDSYAPQSTVVIGRKGSIGSLTLVDGPSWPIDTTYFIRWNSERFTLPWLYRLLETLPLQEMNKSAAVPGLNRDDVYRLTVPVPPIEEQRRIAGILDHADNLRAKRRDAIARLDALVQSVYDNMFVTRAAPDWRQVRVADLAAPGKDSIRTGPFGSQLLKEEFIESGVAVIGIDNTAGNQFGWGERRYISDAKYRQLKRYTVNPGDVLITIMGTNGRVAIVPNDIPTAINTKHLCCISLDQSHCLPEFLRATFLWHPGARKYLASTTKGAIMGGLNMGIIKALPVDLPPIDTQREFAERARAIEGQKERYRAQLAELDRLFASLQARAFRGEL